MKTARQSIKSINRLAVVGLLAALTSTLFAGKNNEGQPSEQDAALDRTRKTVQMLDDVYKTAVVLITDKYVQDENDFPAGSAAIALFDAIKKKGWHDVRLLDATGDPSEAKNVAQDDFEREAIKQLLSGKTYYDQVEQRQNERYLRAATAIPVVHKKCVMCHDAYKEAKEGQAVGALSYTLRIE